MKNYISPDIEVFDFSEQDVITASVQTTPDVESPEVDMGYGDEFDW